MSSSHRVQDDQDLGDGVDAALGSRKLRLGDALPDVQDRDAGEALRGQEHGGSFF